MDVPIAVVAVRSLPSPSTSPFGSWDSLEPWFLGLGSGRHHLCVVKLYGFIAIRFTTVGFVMGEEAFISIFAETFQELTGDVHLLLPFVAEATNFVAVAVGVRELHMAPLVGLELSLLQSCFLEDCRIALHGDVLASDKSQVFFLQLLHFLLQQLHLLLVLLVDLDQRLVVFSGVKEGHEVVALVIELLDLAVLVLDLLHLSFCVFVKNFSFVHRT